MQIFNQNYSEQKFELFRQLGDVPEITETGGLVTVSVTEISKGVPSQAKFQFSVNNAWSNLFDLANDSVDMVSYTVLN